MWHEFEHHVSELTAASKALADEGVRNVYQYAGMSFEPFEDTWAYARTRDTFLVLVALAAIDLLGVRLSGARYYILHFFINLGVVYCTWEDFVALLSNPLAASTTITHNPLPLVYGLHIYHCIAFDDLTPVDWAHHIINVLIMGVIAEGWDWGKGVNATCFIMNGVPGGLDYLLLTLVKHGLMNTMTEKRINAIILNLLIRFPGMTIIAYTMVLCKLNGKLLTCPWWVIGAILVLEWGNAAYFCQRVIGNYYVRDCMKAVRKKAGKGEKAAANGESNGDGCEAVCGEVEMEEEEEFH